MRTILMRFKIIQYTPHTNNMLTRIKVLMVIMKYKWY